MTLSPTANGDRQDSSQTDVLLRLEEVAKIYGEGETEVKALANVSLAIKRGSYCAIMGASGSGKSTMMNIIGCLDRPSLGHYFLDGEDVSGLSADQLAKIRNRKIGFVFQQFYLLPQMTALENVMLPMIYAGIPPEMRKEKAIAALVRVGLSQRLHNRPNQLSGGQQQRVAIARAIVNEPLLLLADEPTGALDSHTTEEVLAIFEQLHSSGITIVVVTHEADVASHSERIISFQDGKIVRDHVIKS
ncbi:ABC transporter ATP-binding protein [Synechocystis sp. PCC 6714]|uniref:ABC transporter ATP-binding protein n=2 Tax=unclassified Synechocystis TaxID=2640012 RepID=UPI000490621A